MKPNWHKRKPKKLKVAKLYDLPSPFGAALLGEQLFDRCEELGIELSMRDSMAIREGMVLVQFSADGPQYQIIPSWITTDGLAKEIVRRQKARGSQ